MPGTYFLTFRTFGTWLPGDERGWTDRRETLYGSTKSSANRRLSARIQRNLTQEVVRFSKTEREMSLRATINFCENYGYKLHAANILVQHVHLVISASISKELLLKNVKAAITKALKYSNLVTKETKIWARHGSTVPLFTQEEFHGAVNYTLNQQESREFCYDGSESGGK